MVQLCTANDPTELSILADQLKRAGIPHQLRGNLQWGGRGELPLTEDTAPSIWVDPSDLARAQKVLEGMASSSQIPSWTCRNCGTVVDGMETCWNCGKDHL